jgi:hypothetical protein
MMPDGLHVRFDLALCGWMRPRMAGWRWSLAATYAPSWATSAIREPAGMHLAAAAAMRAYASR